MLTVIGMRSSSSAWRANARTNERTNERTEGLLSLVEHDGFAPCSFEMLMQNSICIHAAVEMSLTVVVAAVAAAAVPPLSPLA